MIKKMCKGLDFEDIMVVFMVITDCKERIVKGGNPKIEIPFTINVLECVFDTEFTEEQYEEYYEEIYDLIEEVF